MQHFDIVIVGAGAAGLTAAMELSKAGKKVCVLEARNRTGGRINTITSKGSDRPVELGAEFVHGKLPLTLSLLKLAGIKTEKAGGKFAQFKNGKISNDEDRHVDWKALMEKLDKLTKDQNIRSFLLREFPGKKYLQMRTEILRMVKGYDAADPSRTSAIAMREEWKAEDYDHQYRITGGYGKLISWLEEECRLRGCKTRLRTIVQSIKWNRSGSIVQLKSGKELSCSKVIITIPSGVLKSKKNETAHITIQPLPRVYSNAIKDLGTGQVIKVLMQFKENFWKEHRHLGFVFSSEKIPTWWTQYPAESKLLTGWLAGPDSEKWTGSGEAELITAALESISKIFSKPLDYLKKNLVKGIVTDWNNDPFALGAYSYASLKGKEAIDQLLKPIGGVVFFAGETVYEGNNRGTVEAAISSGYEVARKALGI